MEILSADVNECSRNNGRGECQDVCYNTWGSFECSCERLPNGRLSPDGKSCEDAGECANNNGNCSHICLSTVKQVFCLCPEGLELGDDDKTCLGKCKSRVRRKTILCFIFMALRHLQIESPTIYTWKSALKSLADAFSFRNEMRNFADFERFARL